MDDAPPSQQGYGYSSDGVITTVAHAQYGLGSGSNAPRVREGVFGIETKQNTTKRKT